MNRILWVLLAVLLLSAGCIAYDPDEPPPPESSYDPYHYLTPRYMD